MFAHKLRLDDIEFHQRAQRVTDNRASNRPRTIIVKLLRFKNKTKIFQNAN